MEITESYDLLFQEIQSLKSLTGELKSPDFAITKELVEQVVEKITIYDGKKVDIQFSFHFPTVDEVIGDG